MADQQAIDARALWYVGREQAELRAESVPPPGPHEVRLAALFGAISRGTERLVYRGQVPSSEYQRMRAPHMDGSFPFPVKYGYATVGRVEAGPATLRGREVFALFPHQTRFNLAADAVIPLPAGVSPRRAVLAANMETALNAVWDGAPGPADRIGIVGGGLLGLLVAYLCGRLPGADVTVIDVDPARGPIAAALGVRFAPPDAAPADCDLVFHASATAPGLATALRIAGDETTVVELSWFGEGAVAVPLGESFHSRRLKLVSSQVGKVAPSHRARWSYRRRLGASLALLADDILDVLLAPAIAFEDLPARLPDVFGKQTGAVCPLICYPGAVGAR